MDKKIIIGIGIIALILLAVFVIKPKNNLVIYSVWPSISVLTVFTTLRFFKKPLLIEAVFWYIYVIK